MLKSLLSLFKKTPFGNATQITGAAPKKKLTVTVRQIFNGPFKGRKYVINPGHANHGMRVVQVPSAPGAPLQCIPFDKRKFAKRRATREEKKWQVRTTERSQKDALKKLASYGESPEETRARLENELEFRRSAREARRARYQAAA